MVVAPYWVRLVRTGNLFQGYLSPDGIALPAAVYLGLPVTAHNNAVSSVATFINVKITVPIVPPTIALTAPANGATFLAPATINISATVTNYSGTGLNAGTAYYYRVAAANAAGGSPYSAVASAMTVAAPLVKINFQPPGAAVPSGYVADTGAAYGSGRTFGWNTVNTRDRNSSRSADQRHDALNHMQLRGTRTREIAVPNGSRRRFSHRSEAKTSHLC